MTTADQLTVGQHFVATCDRTDFHEAKYESGRGPQRVSKYKVIDGTKLRVVAIVTGDRESASHLMKMYAALPRGDEHQLCSDDWLWIAGMKDKRSPRVIIQDWQMRAYENPEKESRIAKAFGIKEAES